MKIKGILLWAGLMGLVVTVAQAVTTSNSLAIIFASPGISQQSIASINLSGLGFVSGSPSGTSIGTITVGMSPSSPAFSGSLALDTTCGAACADSSKFQLSGAGCSTGGTCTLQTATGAPVSPTFVKGATSSTASATIGTGGIPSGNMAVGIFQWDLAATLGTITDNAGNTYTKSSQTTDGSHNQGAVCFWKANIAGAPTTITANGVGAGNFPSMAVDIFSGAADTLGAGPTSGPVRTLGAGGAINTTTITAASGSLTWSGYAETSPQTVAMSAGGGATQRSSLASKMLTETQTNTGSITPTATSAAAGSFIPCVASMNQSSSGLGSGSYAITIVATQSGALMSPFPQAFTITGAPGPVSVTLTPSSATVADNCTVASCPTSLSQAAATMSDGSGFSGTWTSNNTICSVTSGGVVAVGRTLTSGDDGAQTCTITATQNGISAQANLSVTVQLQVIATVSLSNSAVAHSPPSGTTVGTLSSTLSPTQPATAVSHALSNSGACAGLGTNNASFSITGGTTLVTAGGILADGNYNICDLASASGLASKAQAFTVAVGSAPSVAFSLPTGRTLKFMAATGCNDGNAGTSAAAPWCSPNHAMQCGDVIIAAAGTYGSMTDWGVVSNCPSTTGGIDGNGGIWSAIVLCGGVSVGDCQITSGSTGSAMIEFGPTGQNNWTVEGWRLSSSLVRGFQARNCLTSVTANHHFAFINSIVVNSASAFTNNDCGEAGTANAGSDYMAAVGILSFNSASDSICLGAVDLPGPSNFNTLSGTHVLFAGVFGIMNRTINGCSDGEALMFDTFDAHGYSGQSVMMQNLVYNSGWAGAQIFMQGGISSVINMRLFNNTFFNNLSQPGKIYGNSGGMNMQLDGGFPWNIAAFNNISMQPTNTSPNGDGAYAFLIGGGSGPSGMTIAIGGSGLQNIFYNPGGNNSITFNGFSLGSNLNVTPNFKNTADLLANHVTTPNCSGFETVTACMGWNHVTRTATALSVIDDLTAQAAQAAGKGYQPPGDCVSTGDIATYYPTWLKGIVYLHWDGTSITEKDGLITKPCGL